MGASAPAFAERRQAPEAADPVRRRAGSVDRPAAATSLALLPRGAVIQRACCPDCELGLPCEDEQQGLRVVPSDHPLEQEADRVAARTDEAGSPAEALSRAPAGPAAALALGAGSPLGEAERAELEPRVGGDLGDVRIHTGEEAGGMAEALGARAFTTGRNVVFGANEFAPETGEGRNLLAHELAHTVQQGAGSAGGAAPSTPSCRTASPGFTAGPQLFYEFDKTDLLPGQSPLITSLQLDAVCASAIEFHGNASSEGSAAHNMDLACRRAEAAASLFSTFSARQTLVAHGPTTAYGSAPPSKTTPDPNRCVVVVITPATTPGPLPTRNVTPPSPVPKLLGIHAPAGGCGAGDDSKSADFPAVTGSLVSRSVLLIAAADGLSDATLETGLDTELVTLAGGGAAGTAALARFNAGTGGTAVHGAGSTLATLMRADTHFLGPFHTVEADLRTQAKTQAAGGSLDWTLFSVTAPSIFFPPSSTGFGSGVLASVLGGTQGTKVFISNFVVLPCTRSYTAIIRFVICDDFGVDQGDVKSPGLAGFWVLQHRRPPGHVAFINEVVVDMVTVGTF